MSITKGGTVTRFLLVGIMAVFLLSFLFSPHLVFAPGPVTILWTGGSFCKDSGASDMPAPNTFTVTDPSLSGNGGPPDTINVKINSTAFPSGITLKLTESGDTGQFTDTNLIFTDGVQQYSIGSTQTVGLNEPLLNTNSSLAETFVSGPAEINHDGIKVISNSSPSGIFLTLKETGPNTGIFTSKLKLTSGPSVNGSAIHVQAGDIVSIVRQNIAFVHANELVITSSDPAIGSIPTVQGADTISATYGGVKVDATYTGLCGSGGGGGGGLIQPGLVLDILAEIGGSHVVSPPTFGGKYYHYSDGLTITQGTAKTIFDTSKYNQEIPKQVMVKGQKVNMTFKTFEAYNPTAVIHMGLYIIPRGDDMITPNSIAFIEYDKKFPVLVNDPNHILANASASSESDGTFQYTQFSFVPKKSYDKMSFLVRAWNDHLYSTDIRVHDEIIQPPAPKALPAGVVLYENFGELMTTLEKDQFYKPHIMSHIHSKTDVFSSGEDGKVYWLYDTINHTVTLVIADNNGNEITSAKSSLESSIIEKKGDYKFMKFTVKQLNRADEAQEEHAKELEATKALLLALEKGINFGNR